MIKLDKKWINLLKLEELDLKRKVLDMNIDIDNDHDHNDDISKQQQQLQQQQLQNRIKLMNYMKNCLKLINIIKLLPCY